MTSDTTPPRPTDGELGILQVLWSQGPSTVRQVMQHLNASRPTGYTTVLKFMQIMHDKGLLRRDERQRSHVYHPVHEAEQVNGTLVGDLIDRAFQASAHKLVLHALATKEVSSDELNDIRKLLDKIEEEKKQ